MINNSNFNVASAVSAAVSLTNTDESAVILQFFLKTLDAVNANPLRVLPSVANGGIERTVVQQLQSEGLR